VNLDQISRRQQLADIQFTCDFRGAHFLRVPRLGEVHAAEKCSFNLNLQTQT